SDKACRGQVTAIDVGAAPPVFGARCSGHSALRRSAASTAEAIDSGIDWLLRHQDEDGKWDADEFMKHDGSGPKGDGAGNPVHDIGVTALASLCLLGNGSTPVSGPYREALRKAVAWLIDQQNENGRIGLDASTEFIYDHAIGSTALAEAA